MAKRPDDGEALSRRVFIHRLTFLGGGVVLFGPACKQESAAPQPVRRRGVQREGLITSHLTFTDAEFAVVSAACERVLPRDEDPGALDANVPQYLDRALQTPELAQMKDEFLAGTAALDRRSQSLFHQGFAEATPAQQDELLALFKNSAQGTGEAHYYELLVTLTLEGFLGDPSYGGNKDRVGWALVGFGTSEPPPGYEGVRHLHQHHGGK